MKIYRIILLFIVLLSIISAYAEQQERPYRGESKEEGQQYLLKLEQREQPGTGAITSPPKEAEPKPLKPDYTDELTEGNRYINKAWQYYRSEEYEKAHRLFTAAQKYEHTAREAELGLAFCYLKTEKEQLALPLFKKLVEQRFRLKDTLPSLVELSIQVEDYQSALFYAELFGAEEKEKWQKEINARQKRKRIYDALNQGDIKLLQMVVSENEDAVDSCLHPDLFYQAAESFLRGGEKESAKNLYLKILSACQKEYDLRIGILYNLKTVISGEEMDELLNREMGKDLPQEYRKKVVGIQVDLLRERLKYAGPAGKERLAKQILVYEPEDVSAMSILAWEYHRERRFELSLELFQKLYDRNPQEHNSIRGLIDTLIELNRADQAIDIARKSDMGEQEINKILAGVYLREADEAYQEKDFTRAEDHLKKVLIIEPHNESARILLGWTLYNQDKPREALPHFIEHYQKTSDPAAAEAVLLCSEKMAERQASISFLKELSNIPDPQIRRVAGSYYYKMGMPVTAAQVNPEPGTCYYYADKPKLYLDAYYVHKSGSSGLSRLDRIVYPVSFYYPVSSGSLVGFSMITKKLSAGDTNDAADYPYAGSFYRHIQKGIPQKHDIVTSLWTSAPSLSFEKEGNHYFFLRVGSTPLGGVISPLPTFSAQVGQRTWSVRLHQTPVEESILSYTGLRDPYSRKKWGRVIKSGTEAEISFSIFTSCWLSLKGGYDYLWGEDVWQNQKFEGTVSFGRTFHAELGDISAGLFLTGQHFERNSDFFTYGHGGYYSPDAFLMSGATVQFETKPCRSYWIKGNVALGYFYNTTEDAPHYPLKDTKNATLLDLKKKYQGRDFSGLAYSIQLESMKLITPYLAGGSFFNINKSPNYTEWMSGLQLTFFFGQRSVLLPRADSVQ